MALREGSYPLWRINSSCLNGSTKFSNTLGVCTLNAIASVVIRCGLWLVDLWLVSCFCVALQDSNLTIYELAIAFKCCGVVAPAEKTVFATQLNIVYVLSCFALCLKSLVANVPGYSAYKLWWLIGSEGSSRCFDT